MWPRHKKHESGTPDQAAATDKKELMPPKVESPQGCHGYGAIVAEPFTDWSKTIFTKFGCPEINHGRSEEVYRSRVSVNNESITDVYLQQVKRASEAAIGALCLTCPLNPLNRAPNDISDLDRPPHDV
ncbi:MAG TPA: hypothetical protein VFH99_00345 [Candidatus Saccharimonadales bacterium]|nr:hypothetical protein [Candidatus Saccharimonadales bacterium]